MSLETKIAELQGAADDACNKMDDLRAEVRRLKDAAPTNETVADIIKDVCELPDYTSPDDNPDLLQCTVKELDLILRRHLLGNE